MKRCPQCEFLYEDEQECCDMDGTILRFTSFLPSSALPRPTRDDRKSIWSGLAIPLLALVVIGSVLVTLYRATPRNVSSSSVTRNQTAGANQSPKLPVPDSPHWVTAPANAAQPAELSSEPAARGRDPFARPSQPGQSTNEERLTIEPATSVQMEPPPPVINAPKPAPVHTSPAPPRPNTTPVKPEPPLAKPTPPSKTQNDKDSKLKSVFKKAGRLLKKPF